MDDNKHINDLAEIRALMEKSSRFISLSGLSGVLAGIYALVGAVVAYFLLEEAKSSLDVEPETYYCGTGEIFAYTDFILIGIAVMIASLVTGFIFTSRRAKKKDRMWEGSRL